MSVGKFVVRHAGPHITIQDRGRPGHMRFGVSASGPVDRPAFAIANAALGNPADAPGLEVSIGGLTLTCVEGAVTIAVAGGGFEYLLDQTPLGGASVVTIRAGSQLSIRPGPWGSWTYLCFAGRLQATAWLGSVATLGTSGFGGGRLASGQTLVIDDAALREERCGVIAMQTSRKLDQPVRVVLGPQERFFAPETIAQLFSQSFKLTDAYDRMGVRLAGPPLLPNAKLDMPSEAIVRGSIQVAGDGSATVLLADHQTTGGYPKIATVISCDLDRFAQLRSGDAVAFERIGPEAAIQAVRTQHQAHQHLLLQAHNGARSLTQRLLSVNLIDGVVSAGDR
jgi:biotin-dependent carboxylase-like uncharacterized protein